MSTVNRIVTGTPDAGPEIPLLSSHFEPETWGQLADLGVQGVAASAHQDDLVRRAAQHPGDGDAGEALSHAAAPDAVQLALQDMGLSASTTEHLGALHDVLRADVGLGHCDASPGIRVSPNNMDTLNPDDDTPRATSVSEHDDLLESTYVARTCGTVAMTPTTQIEPHFRLPTPLHATLMEHQRVALSWLWELFQQSTGGILADDMGLGKTLEVIAFLVGLHTSRPAALRDPVLVVTPATLQTHWLREFHQWAPVFRVVLLQQKGTPPGPDPLRVVIAGRRGPSGSPPPDPPPRVLVITYDALRRHASRLTPVPWAYIVLDEGQCIRNPLAMTTVLAKALRSRHRLVLTGTPIQNNLRELWSLFDFAFPGKLGRLETFEEAFIRAICAGSYRGASPIQVRAACNVALHLRGLVTPYLLRRTKEQIRVALPKQSEVLLFVQLTTEQAAAYRRFVASRTAALIRRGQLNMLLGVDILRKICNHVWLTLPGRGAERLAEDPALDQLLCGSCKLQILQVVLEGWRAQHHRVLIFVQTVQMLRLVAQLLKTLGLPALQMHGATPVARRQALVDRFADPAGDLFAFLLTTRVGGVGLSLVAATRVVLLDPDWNPMTDLQARERAYRIGQRRDVEVYRLICRGTIEEKIYNRQLFKLFLAQRVLRTTAPARTTTSAYFGDDTLRDLFCYEGGGDAPPDERLRGVIGDALHAKLCRRRDPLVLGCAATAGEDPISNAEARRIADAAIDRLRGSRVGRRPREVLSASALIRSLKTRGGAPCGRPDAIGALIQQLVQFLGAQAGCEARTADIVAHFQCAVMPTERRDFRQALREVADFDAAARVWRLRGRSLAPPP